MRLSRDTTDPITIVDLTGDGTFDFSKYAGMPETDLGDEGDVDSGNLLLSTIGFDIGSSYSIKLELRKKYA